MLLETLESRRLMSASLSAATHTLVITGTNQADTLVVKAANGKIYVNDNGAAKSFDAAKVAKINVYARAGGDTVKIDASVFKPAEVWTGLGGQFGQPGDSVQGGSGKDTIHLESESAGGSGGAGDDKIIVGAGSSFADGQAGNDTIIVKALSDGSFAGGNGTDTIDFSSATGGLIIRNGQVGSYYEGTGSPPVLNTESFANVSGFENFTGGAGKDYIYGTDGNNVIRGNGGDDELYGRKGSDSLYGGAGKDALYGQEGNDFLYAQDGAKDFLSGGFGTDKAKKDSADTVIGVESIIP